MKSNTKPFLIIISVFFSLSFIKQTDGTKNNIELAKQSFAAFNKHDWKAHAAFFSDTCKCLDPSYGNEYKTISRIEKAAKYKKMQETSPDIQDKITHIFGSGDKVVIQFTSMGTAKTAKG